MNRAHPTAPNPVVITLPDGHLEQFLNTVLDDCTAELTAILKAYADTEQPDFSAHLRRLGESHDKHHSRLYGVSLFLGGIQHVTRYQAIRDVQDALLDRYHVSSDELLRLSNTENQRRTQQIASEVEREAYPSTRGTGTPVQECRDQ